MFLEQMTEQEVEEGLILRRLIEHEDYGPALERLAKKLEEDAVGQFCDDESKGKKWLKGARETARAIIPAIKTRAEAAGTVLEERKEQAASVRSGADDGMGSGDVAL